LRVPAFKEWKTDPKTPVIRTPFIAYAWRFLEKVQRPKKYFTFLKNRFQRYFNGLRRAGAGRARFLCFLACFELRGLKKLCYSSVLRSTRH
jgi:hypothetical protein